LLAEHVYVDRASGNRVIAGTFNTIHQNAYPVQTRQAAVAYISITDVRGSVRLSLRLVDTRTLEVVMQSEELEAKAGSPHETIEAAVPVPGFFLPHEGIYDFELHANGERLGCLRLTALLREQEAGPDKSGNDDESS
jgi:hypothetical protein